MQYKIVDFSLFLNRIIHDETIYMLYFSMLPWRKKIFLQFPAGIDFLDFRGFPIFVAVFSA